MELLKMAGRAAGIVRAPRAPMQHGSKKILIADADNTFRATIRRFMEGLGHQVFEASTGPKAIESAATLTPDLIMLDLRLPEIGGDEATKRLKTNVRTRHIPIIINAAWTTACNVEERAERALLAGAVEILYRPFQMPLLRDILRSHLFA